MHLEGLNTTNTNNYAQVDLGNKYKHCRKSTFFLSYDQKRRAPGMNLMLFSFMLRRMGLEPTRPTGHKILSLACLPISAPPRDSYNIQPRNIKVKKKISLIQKIFDHGSIKTESAELLQIFKLTHFEQYRNGSHPF